MGRKTFTDVRSDVDRVNRRKIGLAIHDTLDMSVNREIEFSDWVRKKFSDDELEQIGIAFKKHLRENSNAKPVIYHAKGALACDVLKRALRICFQFE